MTALREPRPIPPPSAPTTPLAIDTDTPEKLLQRLAEEHQASVWRYLRYLGASIVEAEDLAQETFLEALRASQRGLFEERSTRQTAGYLRTVGRHRLLMLRRRQQREIKTTDLEAAERVWAETLGEENQGGWANLTAKLQGCLKKLAGKAGRAVDLHYRLGASRAAIAEELGMKPEGVKTLLRRTRSTLRECLERDRTHQ